MKQAKINPHESAMNRLYFVNMFASTYGMVKCNDYQEAKQKFPQMAKISEDLKPEQLQLLIERIELTQ
jgi:hypothetical protein